MIGKQRSLRNQIEHPFSWNYSQNILITTQICKPLPDSQSASSSVISSWGQYYWIAILYKSLYCLSTASDSTEAWTHVCWYHIHCSYLPQLPPHCVTASWDVYVLQQAKSPPSVLPFSFST